MNDARKADRLRVVLLARYREPTMLDLREAECRDLSLGGMFVATARPSPRGGLIRFECESNAEGESFRGTARVVWQRSKPDPRGPAGMGVRFVHLEPASREALSKVVARVAQSPASMPAASPAHRSPATETRAAVLPIVELGGPPSGMADKRSALAAPTLRGVAPDGPDDDENESESIPRARFDRTAIGNGAPPPPQQDAPNDARPAGAARMRTDPPPNLVRSPDRPRSDRPPAAGAVNDEPAWSLPRDRTRLDGSGAASARAGASASEPAPPAQPETRREPSLDDFGSYENSEPAVKILGNRALNSTAPGLGGPVPSSPPPGNEPAPAPISDTRELGHRDNGAAQSSPRSTLPEHAPRAPASERPPAADAPIAASPTVQTAPANRPSERPQGYDRPSQRPAPRDRMSERPHARDRNNARDRMSERPPAPGSIDVLRPQSVVHLPSAAVGEPPLSTPPSEGSEVWRGQRAVTDPPPARNPSWDPPPASLAPVRRSAAQQAADDAVEEAEILGSSGSSIPRLSPPRSPLPESIPAGGRSWGALMLWLVIGSGLVVAVVLSKLFGSAPPGLPDQDPAAVAGDVGSQNATQSAALALRYRLVVLTDPPGAKVTVAGTTLVSPAEFGLADMEKPILVSASLPGRMSTSVEINKLQFAPHGERFERELKLTLPALEPEETRTQPPPSEPAAQQGPVPTTGITPVPAPPEALPSAHPHASTPRTPALPSGEPAAQPAQAQPFGTPVLPDRPRAMPPLGAPIAAPSSSATSTNGASAVGSSLSVTPSAATGSLSTVTASSGTPSAPAPGAPAPNDAFKRATDCLLKGDNACVIRELEPNARSAQELEMLIETYRTTRDHGNAERHMARYLAAFPGGKRAGEYGRMLQRTTTPAAPSTPAGTSTPPASSAPGSSSTPAGSTPAGSTPAGSTSPGSTPAATVPKNPLAPPMPPDPPAR
ncbi:MAG TPA: PilZ domain-containing protein [Polyangiales bacterium]|nr:PilZ domain-containing protein [Polyangiales bacterium]